MFSPAVGRVARSSNAFSATPATCLTRSARCAASQHSFQPSHQRRYSSSKPSTPPNSKKKPAELDQNATSNIGGSGKARGGAQDKVKEPAMLGDNIPYVPPTNHLRTEDVRVSSFFGLHRPISISRPFPSVTSVETFDILFDPAQRSHNAEAAQQTASMLEGFLGRMNAEIDAREAQQRDAALEGEVHHLDAAPTEAGIVEFATRLLPFSPPPAPVPQDSVAPEAEVESEGYTAADLSAAINQHMATEVELPSDKPTTFREHVSRRRVGMHAISVKRQRKLKMKKHKYKKLMKRTRLLRRKLDRT